MTDSPITEKASPAPSHSLLGSPVGRLRVVAILETLSFVILLFIAMPLKYMAGKPEAVKVTGAIHGFLFVAFCIALGLAMHAKGWGFGRGARIFIAGLIPFGPFFIDRDLKKEQ